MFVKSFVPESFVGGTLVSNEYLEENSFVLAITLKVNSTCFPCYYFQRSKDVSVSVIAPIVVALNTLRDEERA